MSLFLGAQLLAQMSDWRYYKDSAGNGFYVDGAWKIHIVGENVSKHLLVSTKNVEFAFNLSKKYYREHKLVQYLSLLKSIMGLDSDNMFVSFFRQRAAKEITKLRQVVGDRYYLLNQKANIAYFKNGDFATIVDDDMGYIYKSRGRIEFYRKRFRQGHRYRYSSLKIGESIDNSKGVDFILFFNSEIFLSKIERLDITIENWQNNIGADRYKRVKIYSDRYSIIYSLEGKGNGVRIYGYERIIFYENRDYLIRVLTVKRDDKLKMEMLKAIKNFSVVKNGYIRPL